jgi:D-sedoheptulose 7-phosphate isomerase
VQTNIDALVLALKAAKKRDCLVVLAGNGGSMVNALHMELHLQEVGIRAITLSNPGILTARANDYGIESMFSLPLDALARKNDLFMAISGSGSSLNILAAVDLANKRGILSAGISFTKNSPLLKFSSYPVLLPSANMGIFEDDCSQLAHSLKRYL